MDVSSAYFIIGILLKEPRHIVLMTFLIFLKGVLLIGFWKFCRVVYGYQAPRSRKKIFILDTVHIFEMSENTLLLFIYLTYYFYYVKKLVDSNEQTFLKIFQQVVQVPAGSLNQVDWASKLKVSQFFFFFRFQTQVCKSIHHEIDTIFDILKNFEQKEKIGEIR